MESMNTVIPRPYVKCQWNVGQASEEIGVILVKLIVYSGKLPSRPVDNNPNFAAWAYLGVGLLG